MDEMMPRIRIPRSLAGALVLMLAVSCQNPVCGCLSPPDVAVLYGSVTDAAGNPVEKAAVRAEEGPPGCQAAGVFSGFDETDAAGRYRAEVHAFRTNPECTRAFALPPAGSTLRGSDTVPFQVTFSPRRPEDSVRVDLVLRAP
jgi:hypothetical protein